MRIRRRLSEGFGKVAISIACCAVISYFGYNGIFGPRGLLAWNEAEARLSIARRDLAQLRAERTALQHRNALLDEDALDPDLLEEVARGMLFQGSPGDVAIPRE